MNQDSKLIILYMNISDYNYYNFKLLSVSSICNHGWLWCKHLIDQYPVLQE